MKLLNDIKDGIVQGNWQTVCDAYFKITGEKLSPPVVKQEFDVDTANKRQLYAYLKDKRELEDIKKYKTDELREICQTFIFMQSLSKDEDVTSNTEVREETQQPSDNFVADLNSSPFYVSNESLLVEGDKTIIKNKLQPTDSIMKTLVDSGDKKDFIKEAGRAPFQLTDITCIKCGAADSVHPQTVLNNKATCNKCRNSGG